MKLTINLKELEWHCNATFDELATRYNMTVTETNGQKFAFADRGAEILGVAHTDYVVGDNHFFTGVLNGHPTIFSSRLDDRMGVYLLGDLLPRIGMKYDLLFTDEEEHGKSSAKHFVAPEGRVYNWGFEFDRAGSDVVTYRYKAKAWLDVLAKYFKVGIGSYSDINDLPQLGCQCVNIGCGYEWAHHLLSYALSTTTIRQVKAFRAFWKAEAKTHYPYKEPEAVAYITANTAKKTPCGRCGGACYGIYHLGEQEVCYSCWQKEDGKTKCVFCGHERYSDYRLEGRPTCFVCWNKVQNKANSRPAWKDEHDSGSTLVGQEDQCTACTKKISGTHYMSQGKMLCHDCWCQGQVKSWNDTKKVAQTSLFSCDRCHLEDHPVRHLGSFHAVCEICWNEFCTTNKLGNYDMGHANCIGCKSDEDLENLILEGEGLFCWDCYVRLFPHAKFPITNGYGVSFYTSRAGDFRCRDCKQTDSTTEWDVLFGDYLCATCHKWRKERMAVQYEKWTRAGLPDKGEGTVLISTALAVIAPPDTNEDVILDQRITHIAVIVPPEVAPEAPIEAQGSLAEMVTAMNDAENGYFSTGEIV
jgi:hypothetical protein